MTDFQRMVLEKLSYDVSRNCIQYCKATPRNIPQFSILEWVDRSGDVCETQLHPHRCHEMNLSMFREIHQLVKDGLLYSVADEFLEDLDSLKGEAFMLKISDKGLRIARKTTA